MLAVSHHARKRFLERGRLLLYPEELQRPVETIRRMVETGYINMRLEMSPFYKNKLGARQVRKGRYVYC